MRAWIDRRHFLAAFTIMMLAGGVLGRPAYAQTSPSPDTQTATDPKTEALDATVNDLTQVWIAMRTKLIEDEARIKQLEAENSALKAKSPDCRDKAQPPQ